MTKHGATDSTVALFLGSVETVRLCLSTHIEKTGSLAELSFTVTIAVAFLGIFVQINTATVYYDNVNYKEKLFSYKYCIKLYI